MCCRNGHDFECLLFYRLYIPCTGEVALLCQMTMIRLNIIEHTVEHFSNPHAGQT